MAEIWPKKAIFKWGELGGSCKSPPCLFRATTMDDNMYCGVQVQLNGDNTNSPLATELAYNHTTINIAAPPAQTFLPQSTPMLSNGTWFL